MFLQSNFAELVQRRRHTKSKAQVSEIDRKIEALLESEVKKAEDFAPVLTTIEKQFTKYHLPAKAMVSAFKELPERAKTALFESLRAKTDKSLIYQFVARLLGEGMVAEGWDLLSFCCDRVTENGKKRPSKSIISLIGSALFLVPGLKEKPMKIVVEKDMSVSMILCLLPVIFDTELKERRDKKYPVIADKIIMSTVEVWTRLDAEEREMYTNYVAPVFEGRDIDDLLFNKELQKAIPSGFMTAVHMTEPDHVNENDSERLTQEDTQERPVREAALTDVSTIATIVPGPVKPAEDQAQRLSLVTEQHFEPISAAQSLLSWVKNRQELVRNLSEAEENLQGENENLKQQVLRLTAENASFQQMGAETQSLVQRQQTEIKVLSEKIEAESKEHGRRIKAIVEESEKREERRLGEIRNRIASDLKPIINEIRLLSAEDDTASKARGLTKLFKTMIDILEYSHGVKFDT